MIGNLWKTSLKTKIDLHKGIHLTIGEAPPVAEFADYLNQLEEGKEYRSIWVELKTSHIPLLDLCTNKLNYTIHQGLGKDIVLNKWLSQQENKIVPYSIFWVAAGALVVHNNKVLLVQEKGVEILSFRDSEKENTVFQEEEQREVNWLPNAPRDNCTKKQE